MTPLAAQQDAAANQQPAPSSSSGTTKSPARGIAMGAALSAPLWLGILYLVRLLIDSI